MMKLPIELYHKIYDILEQYAGAPMWDRNGFINNYSTNDNATIYYCCFALGITGKFHNENGKIFISSYTQNDNDEHYLIVEKVNALLQDLLDNYLNQYKS